jgi:hypothetical protein
MDLLLRMKAHMGNGNTHTLFAYLRGITIPTAFALVGFYALYLLRA